MKSSLLPLFQERDLVWRAIEDYSPDYVHFCQSLTNHLGQPAGIEDLVSFQADFKESFPQTGIIRTLPVPRKGYGTFSFPHLEVLRSLEEVSDFFLLDTWIEKEPVKGFIGITGRISNWSAAREIVLNSRIPVILAGGISPENAHEAVLSVVPAGIDSCTWTNRVDKEGNPIRFQKDFNKVEALVKEARRAEQALENMKDHIEETLTRLKAELAEREAALPAHSIRPHQLLLIEDLEDQIAQKEKELACLELAVSIGR
ncbi:MAG: hypothetical protein JRH06_04590 [Deltaproteobacteria bacterium]|nr:hypothetical protein [Deltaproteobacteria bacterium]